MLLFALYRFPPDEEHLHTSDGRVRAQRYEKVDRYDSDQGKLLEPPVPVHSYRELRTETTSQA